MKRLQSILLVLIFVISISLHFYGLSSQEFIGDEAAPILLIDRAWDSIPLKDVRFLAYPFLFYNEPGRSIFSGTLLHFLGPDRTLLRLPSIIFGLLTLCLLIWIFKKEKITPWLINLSMISYSISSLIIDDRREAGDSQTRFFILLTGYFIWKSNMGNNVKHLQKSLLAWTMGTLTMLDTFALLPGVIVVFFKKRFLINRKTFYLILSIILFLILYFSAWIILPYLAYKANYQHYLLNRGFFYYFSRVREGILSTPLDSIKALINYTSPLFALWIMGTSLLTFKIKKFLFINIVNMSIWASVIFLNHSGYHVVTYIAFFFYQAVMITDYAVRKYSSLWIFIAPLITCIIVANILNLFTNYFTISKSPLRLVFTQKLICLDNPAVRLYKDHGKNLSIRPCEISPVK
jgi:hypothetical protein